jgi:hypothetical protein
MVRIDKNLNMEGKKITDEAFYISKWDIIEVTLKDAVDGPKKIKPLNGYWVKKSAIPTKASATKKVLSLKEFSQKKPDIKSPFVGEEDVVYKAIYDKLNDKFLYFKNGRRNSTKISMQKAYDTYLYDEGQKMERGGGVDSWKKIVETNIAGDYSEELKSYIYKNAKIYYSKSDKQWILEINNKIIKSYKTLATAKRYAEMMLLDAPNSMEQGGEIEAGMIITFKDEFGDLHNGKIIKKSIFDNSYDVQEVNSKKAFLVSKNQIV